MTYLLDIHESMFKLHIKSTDILYSSIICNGSFGFRVLHQASKRAFIPVHLRANTPIRYVNYNDKPETDEKIAGQKIL